MLLLGHPENKKVQNLGLKVFSERDETRKGCQMVYFHTKNPNLSIFWRASDGKCWYIYGSFGNLKATYYGNFVAI
jgi:hypothetical protein